jgi:putative oxidoreductase
LHMSDTPPTRDVCSTPVNLGLLLVRIPVGLFFFLAGYGKISGGVEKFVSAVISHVPSFMPERLGSMYLHALPFVELLTGVMIVLGAFTRVAAAVQALMLISFMLAMGIKPPSGPFHYNFVFLGVALMLVLIGPGKWSVDQPLFCRKAVTQ